MHLDYSVQAHAGELTLHTIAGHMQMLASEQRPEKGNAKENVQIRLCQAQCCDKARRFLDGRFFSCMMFVQGCAGSPLDCGQACCVGQCKVPAGGEKGTCEGTVPPKIWPVIMPGMETTPMTLIWLRTGVRASTRQRCRVSRVASMRLAPSANSSSMRPLPAHSSVCILYCVVQSTDFCTQEQ